MLKQLFAATATQSQTHNTDLNETSYTILINPSDYIMKPTAVPSGV